MTERHHSDVTLEELEALASDTDERTRQHCAWALDGCNASRSLCGRIIDGQARKDGER